MNGWILVGFGALISVVDFVVGLRFSRMTGEQLERNDDGSLRSPERINRLGRIVMIVSPIFLLVLAALGFGLFGPIAGIETIRLD